MRWEGLMAPSHWPQWRGDSSQPAGITWVLTNSLSCRFDPVNGQWSAVAPLLSKRKHLGVAVHHNMIYAVGGRDQHTELNSVERSEFIC